MTKATSKLLTLLLSFAMVFTTFAFAGGAIEVNASEGQQTLRVKVVDQNGAAVRGIVLWVDNDDGNSCNFPETSETGETERTFDWMTDGIYGDSDDYTVSLGPSDEDEWEIGSGVSFTAIIDDSGAGYIEKVNDADYNGEQITMTLVAKGGGTEPEPIVIPVDADFNKTTGENAVDATTWEKCGIQYRDIDFDTDVIVDVRNTTDPEGKMYIDPEKDPHFVYCKNVDVTKGESLSDEAKSALNELKGENENKRFVFICYSGNKYARRAMQWAKEAGLTIGKGGKATYLIGGANGVLDGPNKLNLGVKLSEVDLSKDVILDVRDPATGNPSFNTMHLPGSINVSLMQAGTPTDADKSAMSDALTSVGDGGKLVIICYQGKGLAYKAMNYFMHNAETNLGKVSYLIGGANGVENSGIFIGAEKARTMEVDIDMSKYPKGETVRVWIPVPQDSSVKGYEYQSISGEKFWANKAKEAKITTVDSGEFKDKMLYIEWGPEVEPADRKAALKYDAKRVLVGNNGIFVKTESSDDFTEVQEYINKESKYVKVNDAIVQEYAHAAVAGLQADAGTYEKARAVYDWVIANLERIDNGETLKNASDDSKTFEVIGCGYGDTVKILTDLKVFGRAGGHCTDINSTFVALCRANGIPAREMFGIRMNDDATGGQHCWAEVYIPGPGWIFADPGDVLKKAKGDTKNMTLEQLSQARDSEAVKTITKELWGGVDNNRVVLSRGRDIDLDPKQTGDAYNTFGYPCAEHNGHRIECTDAKNFVYTISSKPYGTDISPAPAAPAQVPEPAVTDGQTAVVNGNTVKVLSASAGTAQIIKGKNAKTVTIPATVTVNGKELTVTGIAKKAFKGSKAKTLIVKSKKLTKKSVKGSLKGSKVKTVKVKVGKKKENKKFVKKYKKIFTKKNAGKKVKVK